MTFTYWRVGEPNNYAASEDEAIMNCVYLRSGGGFGDWTALKASPTY